MTDDNLDVASNDTGKLSPQPPKPNQSGADWWMERDEVANQVTHGLGFLISLIGTIAMARQVLPTGDPWRIVGCMIFVLSMNAMYAMSTLSHCSFSAEWKNFYRKMDQAFIYLLIVGTYTPIAMTYLQTPFWLGYLGVLWTIAIVGFASKTLYGHEVDRVSIWIYVALGWMPIFSTYALLGKFALPGLLGILLGGVCYTLGTVFLLLDQRVPHFHALWHLAVIAGSTFHYFAILFYVAPIASPA